MGHRRGRVRSCLLALAALVLVAPGGRADEQRSAGGTVPPGRPRAALMPFENLSGREDQSQLFTRIFFTKLVESRALDVVDPVEVDAAMDSLRLRATGSMTSSQLRAMGDTLHVPYILLGSVLESGMVRDPDGEIPSVGAALRLVEVATTRVAWAGVRFLSGGDGETVFGWGRVRSTEKLILQLAHEMLSDFRKAGRAASNSRTEDKR